MFVRVLIIASFVSASSLVMTCWRVFAFSLLMRFQSVWKNFFVFTEASKRERIVLNLTIIYVHFRHTASISIFSRDCWLIVLRELVLLVEISWLNRQRISRRQQSRLKSKQSSDLLCLEVMRCSHRQDKAWSNWSILKDVLNDWLLTRLKKETTTCARRKSHQNCKSFKSATMHFMFIANARS
jgi:hypothetical protein